MRSFILQLFTYFLCSLSSSLFSSPFPLLFSQYTSLFFLFLCHIHKHVLSVSQVLIAGMHWRQQMFLFLRTASTKWCFKLPLFLLVEFFLFNSVFRCFYFACFSSYSDLWAASVPVEKKVTRLRWGKGKRPFSQRPFWHAQKQKHRCNNKMNHGWISTELLWFQGPGVVQAGSLSHGHGLLGHLNMREPWLLLLVTPVLFRQVKMSAVVKAYCRNSNEV